MRIERRVVGTDAILAVRNQPDSDKPLVEGERGILKDSRGLDGELFPSVLAPAFPHPASREESHIIPATSGTLDAGRTAPRYHEFQKRLTESSILLPLRTLLQFLALFRTYEINNSFLFMGLRTPRQKIGGAGRDTSRLAKGCCKTPDFSNSVG